MFRRSSAVEQLTVNQLVVGSIPTAGAKDFKGLAVNQLGPFSLPFALGEHRGNRSHLLPESPFRPTLTAL